MTVPAQAQGTRAKPSESSSGSAPAISGRIVAGAGGIGMSQGAQNRGCYVAGGVRLDLLGAPSLVLTRGGRIVAVAINDHKHLSHLFAAQISHYPQDGTRSQCSSGAEDDRDLARQPRPPDPGQRRE